MGVETEEPAAMVNDHHVAVAFEVVCENDLPLVDGLDIGAGRSSDGNAVADGVGIELRMLVATETTNNLTADR